jgi:hypothetical protein
VRASSKDSYSGLQEALQQAAKAPKKGLGARRGIRRFFRKTYAETVSYGHVLFTFHRVIAFHVVLAHFLIAGAFGGWRFASTCSVSQGTIMMWHTLWGAAYVQEQKSGRHATRRRRVLVFSATLLLHCICPFHFVLAIATGWRASEEFSSGEWVKQQSSESDLLLFDIVSLMYMLFSCWDLLRLSRPLSERAFGQPFLGAARQLRSPAMSCLVYSSFWLQTLAIKIVFDYFVMIKPLVEPTRALWKLDLYCWGLNVGGFDCQLDMVNLFDQEDNVNPPDNYANLGAGSGYVHVIRWLRMRFFSILLICLRWFTPCIIMLIDTLLAYTITSGIYGGIFGSWLKVGEIVTWSDVVRRMEDCVRLVNSKLLPEVEYLAEQDKMHSALHAFQKVFENVRQLGGDGAEFNDIVLQTAGIDGAEQTEAFADSELSGDGLPVMTNQKICSNDVAGCTDGRDSISRCSGMLPPKTRPPRRRPRNQHAGTLLALQQDADCCTDEIRRSSSTGAPKVLPAQLAPRSNRAASALSALQQPASPPPIAAALCM